MRISWENIDVIDDFFITYLLYKESKSVPQISIIRNLSEEEVKDQIIEAKLAIREYQKEKGNQKEDLLDEFLKLNKSNRLDFMDSLDDKKMLYFKRRLFKRITEEKNAEDLISLIWATGELKDSRFLDLLHQLTDHRHSDVRRITYSALRKIGSKESKEFLEKGLYDSNAQTRQYSAKALSEIGDDVSLKILKRLSSQNKNSEKGYVLRAYDEAINTLEQHKI
ncbi:HEAT repeat domain-containing protein [Clostridioides mangenotii]|uniref:HEAT repeat domain-containing protein n=1 Tax=Metaclostridioides mangenotii TaxID=1540 RepID=UPI001C105E19|nr:HEAT repeat domain-containing protein [Clostridioides mangenotii]MCR1955417.1 HEAT repeat domain-containing protein [Clostridioides mangenotii]